MCSACVARDFNIFSDNLFFLFLRNLLIFFLVVFIHLGLRIKPGVVNTLLKSREESELELEDILELELELELEELGSLGDSPAPPVA